MMTVRLEISIPDAVRQWMQPPPERMRAALEIGALAAMRDCVRNFEKQGYEDPPGVFHPWKELSPVTLQRARERAEQRVGKLKRFRRVRTPLGPLEIAVGTGGEQRTARVRRGPGSMILVDTGRLRASLLGGPNHIQRMDGPDGIVVGTNVKYASVHEKGATIPVTEGVRKFLGMEYGVWVKPGGTLSVPPRPFIRLSRDGLDTMARLMLRALVERR